MTDITFASLAIQCTPPGAQGRGSYLFDPDTRLPISPVFAEGLIPLYAWCKANGWTSRAPHDPKWPVGAYERKV